MVYECQDLEGYKFICNIYSIISRSRTMKEAFIENMKDPSCDINEATLVKFLSENWVLFSKNVLKNNPDLVDSIIKHYDFFCFGKEVGSSLLKKYQDRWQDSVNGVIRKKKETRDPHFSFGIALAISVATISGSDNRDFYIGLDEAKKILFCCLKYFGHQDIEFIPDDYFQETDNLRKLLFTALYSALMFLYPAKGGVTKQNNYDNGVELFVKVIKSDDVSKLFAAFQHVAEAKEVAYQLWSTLDIEKQQLLVSNSQKLPVSEYYILPDIISNRKMGILACENGQPVRSLVEGKSGCGKSTLATIISVICQNEISCYDKYKTIAERLDFRKKMWPLVIECKALHIDDVKNGIIEVGLKQLLKRASMDNATINSQHYRECEKYLIAFCKHKIFQEELLLIIDDYSKIPNDCINEFNRLLKELCAVPTLHIVVITDYLKPSAKLRLKDSFRDSYNEFGINDMFVDTNYVSSVVGTPRSIYGEKIQPDALVQMYVNTPRRLHRYAQSLLNSESIHSVISGCLDEELDIKKRYFEFRDDYPVFIRELTLLALKERREKERLISKLTISEKQARKIKEKNESWNEIWASIEIHSILLEQCKDVNSMEFSTPLYFYNVLADYYQEILQGQTQIVCAEKFVEEFSYLSCMELANVLILLFYRLYEEDFERIPDTNAEFFIKAIVAKLFEVETVQDIEYYQWALSCMMSEEYKTLFIHGGNPIRRQKIWRALKRAYISLDVCKDTFCEYKLLSP